MVAMCYRQNGWNHCRQRRNDWTGDWSTAHIYGNVVCSDYVVVVDINVWLTKRATVSI